MSRFALVDPSLTNGTSLVRHWKAPRGTRANEVTEFLGRLWALFGTPRSYVGDGYEYAVRDTELDVVFSVYSGPSGPAFGAQATDHQRVGPAVDALEALIHATAAIDCHWETDCDYGPMTMGIRDGVHYVEVDHDMDGEAAD